MNEINEKTEIVFFQSFIISLREMAIIADSLAKYSSSIPQELKSEEYVEKND